MNKKAKVFSLISLSGAMLFSFAFIGKNFDFLSALADSSNQIVSGSLVFTEASIETDIHNRYYSSGCTSGGKQLYLISIYDANCDPDGSVINFGDSNSEKVTFFVSEYQNGKDPVNGSDSVYRFQGINSISFGVGTTGACYGKYRVAPTSRSIDSTADNSVSLSNKVQSFSSPVHCVKFVNMYFLIGSKATSMSFNYTCDSDYVDIPHQVNKSYNTDAGTLIITSDTELYDGEECKFSFTRNESSDFTLNHFYIINYPEIIISVRKEGIYQKDVYYFTMPNSDVTISAVFDEPIKYDLTANPTTNGSISITTSQYKAGATASFDVIPDSGYIIDSVLSSPSCSFNIQGSTYSFTMPASDVAITASFVEAPEQYTVSISSSIEHGTVSADKYLCFEGEKVTLTVAPDSNYEVEKVTVDGSPISPINDVYSFNMPNHNVEVSATFKESGQPTVTTYFGEFTNSTTVRSCTLIINDDGTGTYTMARRKDGVLMKTITQYFLWTRSNNVLNVVRDTTYGNVQTDSSGDRYHLLYTWSGDTWSDKNTITLSSEGTTASFIGMYNTRAGSASVTLNLV